MLILSRRTGESIIIGEGNDKIVITLLSIQGGQSKLGIAAPKNVSVHREEIFKRIEAEKENEGDADSGNK